MNAPARPAPSWDPNDNHRLANPDVCSDPAPGGYSLGDSLGTPVAVPGGDPMGGPYSASPTNPPMPSPGYDPLKPGR